MTGDNSSTLRGESEYERSLKARPSRGRCWGAWVGHAEDKLFYNTFISLPLIVLTFNCSSVCVYLVWVCLGVGLLPSRRCWILNIVCWIRVCSFYLLLGHIINTRKNGTISSKKTRFYVTYIETLQSARCDKT